MGATYGLGIVSSVMEADAPRDAALAVLRSVARFAGVAVRDVLLDDDVVEVAPDGAVTPLDGPTADELRAAVHDRGGSAAYAAFKSLDGFHIAIAGAAEEGAPDDAPDGVELYVNPLASLRAQLDRADALDDVPPVIRALHRALRALCDDSERLGVPVVLGS